MNTTNETQTENTSNASKNAMLIKIGIIALIILTVTTIAGIALALSTQNTVVKGINVDGQDVSGLTRNQLSELLTERANEHITLAAINLNYQQKNWKISPDDIKYSIDIETAVEEAYAPGHTDSLFQNLTENLHCMFYGKNIVFNVSYDPNLLDAQLQKVAQDIYKDPVNATCYFTNGGGIGHTKAVQGEKLNVEELAQNLENMLNSMNVPSSITLEPVITQPYVQDSDVANINSVIGSYNTTFSEGAASRSYNIRIASSAIDSAIIKPNQEFSFNDTVGHRTAERGYKSAPVIIEGKVAQDWGGGVCQVSSTLYNAVLLAGLTPTERSNHSLPSSYVPLGQDATVADGLLDFKFRNPLAHSVYILTSCYSGNLTVYILGCNEDLQGKSYRVTNVNAGGGITVYRITYKNGEEIERENLHTDSYD